eukprot:8733560-Lingulodinium_polyedra.AAC.1
MAPPPRREDAMFRGCSQAGGRVRGGAGLCRRNRRRQRRDCHGRQPRAFCPPRPVSLAGQG